MAPHAVAPTVAPAVAPPQRRGADLAVTLMFILFIVFPGLGLLAGIDRATISESEMRELTPFPRWWWSRSAIAAWPAAYQKYFEDHFTFRNRLIEWQSAILWHGLRTSSSDTVIAGRDGWLFYADDGGLQDWIQVEPFTTDDLEAWRLTLERTRDWLAARGIPYLVVIAPDKQMIYPEHMPRSLHRMRADYRVDQLIAYLGTHSTLRLLDLRPTVLAAKHTDLLYHLYDTHWNDRGGLVGYRAIVDRLRVWFPQLPVLQRSDFDAVAGVPSGDKTTMLGLTDPGKVTMPGLVLRRGWAHRTVEPRKPDPYGEEGRLATEIPGSNLPRAVMFRDSFAGRLMPYLSEDFSRIVYLWQNDFDMDVVRQEHPDVVIQEFVARHLITYGPYPDSLPH